MYTYTHTHCESVSHSLSGGAPEEEEDDHHHRHHHHSLVNDVSVYRQLARRETNMAALSLLPIATPGHSNSTQTAKEELSLNSAHHPPKVHTQSLIFPHRRATREFALYTATSAAAYMPSSFTKVDASSPPTTIETRRRRCASSFSTL